MDLSQKNMNYRQIFSPQNKIAIKWIFISPLITIVVWYIVFLLFLSDQSIFGHQNVYWCEGMSSGFGRSRCNFLEFLLLDPLVIFIVFNILTFGVIAFVPIIIIFTIGYHLEYRSFRQKSEPIIFQMPTYKMSWAIVLPIALLLTLVEPQIFWGFSMIPIAVTIFRTYGTFDGIIGLLSFLGQWAITIVLVSVGAKIWSNVRKIP